MTKKAQVVITITKGKHKTQPYSFAIDKPGGGPVETARERYTTRRAAIRGALRKLGAYTEGGQARATYAHKGKVYPITLAN
jgi:hypothetical protein